MASALMSEEAFVERTQGVQLSDREKAHLRRRYGLPHDENLIDDVELWRNAVLRTALGKLADAKNA